MVQPRTEDAARQKETRWIELTQAPVGGEVWTRSILLNEVLFDADARPWSKVARATTDLVEALEALGVPHYPGPSGGKGTHTSVFLDPASIRAPAYTLERAQRLGVDIWTEARLAFANAVLDAASVPAEEGKRWAPPLGATGVWDRSKVKWSAARAGSMVRVLGTPGSAGFRKTLAPEDWDAISWAATVKLDKPPVVALRFHYQPILFSVPRAINDTILERVEAAITTAEHRAAVEQPKANPLVALRKLQAVPCIARILQEPAPRGTRHYAFLNLSVTAKHLGVARQAAENVLRRALELCGLDDNDPAMAALHEVYDGRYNLLAACCPSPHVRSWCEPNGCPLSNRYEF